MSFSCGLFTRDLHYDLQSNIEKDDLYLFSFTIRMNCHNLRDLPGSGNTAQVELMTQTLYLYAWLSPANKTYHPQYIISQLP